MATTYTHTLKDLTLSCNAGETCVKTVSEYLLEKSREHATNGKTTWTVDSITGESFTFAEFDEFSRNIASAFHKRGMKKGDIVVYMCYDIVKLHIFFNGVWRANGVLRSQYPEELEDSVLKTVVEAQAKWILCDATEVPICLAVAKKVDFPLEVIVTGGNCNIEGCTSIYDFYHDDGSECPQLETNAEDPAIIISTGGTTGRSKGALHSHQSVVNMWNNLGFNHELADRCLFVSKASHVSGSLMTIYCLSQGKMLITTPKNKMNDIFHAFDKYKPGFIFAFPSYLIALANDSLTKEMDKSCIQFFLTGGTAIKPTLESELKEKFLNLKSLFMLYGSTESFPLVGQFYLPNSQGFLIRCQDMPDGSIGKVNCGVSLQVRDDNGTNILGPNIKGEFCVKNQMMFSHYLGQAEESRLAFTEDGWFRTGDNGYYDENGFVFFSGRAKEMFKCSGNHVFPSTIDEVINKHPSVADVCTIGVDDPEGDEKMPRAFVVLHPGVDTSAKEILEFANKNLPVYKHLRGGLYCVPRLPTNSSGKVTRLCVSQICVPN